MSTVDGANYATISVLGWRLLPRISVVQEKSDKRYPLRNANTKIMLAIMFDLYLSLDFDSRFNLTNQFCLQQL